MQTVDWYDVIRVNKTSSDGIHIYSDSKNVPTDSSNIVYRVAKAFLNKLNITEGISIEIEKNILQLSNFRGKIVVKISGYVSRRVEGALHPVKPPPARRAHCTQLSPHRRGGGGQGRHKPLSLVATSEISSNGIFLFVSFFFLCLYWQKEKAD
jgi:hypothetical protein